MYAFYLDGSYEQTEYENEYYYRPSNDYECYCSQLNKDKMTITNYMTNENVCVLHGAGKSESVVAYFGNRFITSQGNYYTFYDRINSKKSQNYLLKNLYIYSVTDDNFLFGMAVYGKSSHYVKINLDEVTYDIDCTITEPAETKYGFESYFKKPETSDPELKTLVDELDEKYNIEVSFELADDREHSIDCYDMIDFNGDKIAALNDVKDYLSLWPEDICREITGDPDVKVWIYICDDITPNVNNPEIITPAGYVTEYDGHPTMCIITYNNTEVFLNTFSHEFIHLLDYQLKPEQLQEWAAISPSDAYTNSYASYSGQNKYVDYSTGDTEIYFARDYGRTNCEEDRATIGEALYDSYVMEARKKCLDFEGTKAKCEALCRFMRECYPCLASVPEGELYLEKAMNMQAEYFKPRSNEENYQPDPGYGQG